MQTTQNPYKTLLVILIGLLIAYLKFKIDALLYAVLIIAVISILSQRIATYIDMLWMKLAWVLSLIVPNIVLSLVFFGILTPIAFLSKLFGAKTGIDLKDTSTSFFKEVDKTFDKSSFEKTW